MDKKLIYIGVSALALIGLIAVVSFLFSKPPAFRGTSYAEPFPVASDFSLTRTNGTDFTLSNQRGKIVLLFFGYTSCPDVCPTTLAEMNLVMNQLGEKGDGVQIVFISVDPKRDTPELVQVYVERFHPSFIGLSGSQQELEPIWQNYSIFREEVESDSSLGVIVNHTARLYLVDSEGNLRLSYAYGTPVDDIVHDIELLLRSQK